MGTLTITNQLNGSQYSIDKTGTVKPLTGWPERQKLLSQVEINKINKEYTERLNALIESFHNENLEYDSERYKLDCK